MGTLVSSSVPLVQSIGIARGILNNRRIAGTLETFGDNLVRGNTSETSGTITAVGKT